MKEANNHRAMIRENNKFKDMGPAIRAAFALEAPGNFNGHSLGRKVKQSLIDSQRYRNTICRGQPQALEWNPEVSSQE